MDVDIALDTEPREVIVPADFAEALDSNLDARRTFDRLSYSHQLRHVKAIDEAKADETRQRRIAKALAILGEN